MVKKYMFTSVKDRNTHVRRSEPSHSGVTKTVQITYRIVNGKITPATGWVKP
jgi:hypothetical protein